MHADLWGADARPRIMGILNVTPDSFSDGGRYLAEDAAIAQGVLLAEQGADIIDIGGESTRPGADPVPAPEQERRVIGVIRGLRSALGEALPISIDTTSARVARAALDAGATWINDTSGGQDDPQMLPLAATRATPIVLMHRQGTPRTMQQAPEYGDVCREVREQLRDLADAALQAGVMASRILLDPGIGFGKTTAHNLTLLSDLAGFSALGFTLLLGTSRKRFMREICGVTDPTALAPATCATTALGVMAGVSVFRVHDVAENRQAADLAWALRQATSRR